MQDSSRSSKPAFPHSRAGQSHWWLHCGQKWHGGDEGLYLGLWSCRCPAKPTSIALPSCSPSISIGQAWVRGPNAKISDLPISKSEAITIFFNKEEITNTPIQFPFSQVEVYLNYSRQRLKNKGKNSFCNFLHG
jgi:hypothetical protein